MAHEALWNIEPINASGNYVWLMSLISRRKIQMIRSFSKDMQRWPSRQCKMRGRTRSEKYEKPGCLRGTLNTNWYDCAHGIYQLCALYNLRNTALKMAGENVIEPELPGKTRVQAPSRRRPLCCSSSQVERSAQTCKG